MPNLPDDSLDLVFRSARTYRGYTSDPVSDETLRAAWELAKMGPTSANSLPLRMVFVRSAEAKERLRPTLARGNVDKVMSAPVTAIFAYDHEFYENLPRLFPQADMRTTFKSKPELVEPSGKLSATLQIAYFIIAARALGLDCGPMAGFDNAAVDAAFLAGTTWRSLLLCILGHGDVNALPPRNPRLAFDEVAKVL